MSRQSHRADLAPWRLCVAALTSPLQWSFGRVEEESDLASPRTFGPERDLACACGARTGAASVGMICDRCGVLVSDDAEWQRHTRLGHLELAVPCAHPLDAGRMLMDLCVAPIAFRYRLDGTPTPLGRKYQGLVQTNRALAGQRSLGRAGNQPLHLETDGTALSDAVRTLIGPGPDGAALDEPQTLLAHLQRALLQLEPWAFALARSCHLEIRLSVGV